MAKSNNGSHGKLSEPENFKPMKTDKQFKVGNTFSKAKTSKGSGKAKNMCMGGKA